MQVLPPLVGKDGPWTVSCSLHTNAEIRALGGCSVLLGPIEAPGTLVAWRQGSPHDIGQVPKPLCQCASERQNYTEPDRGVVVQDTRHWLSRESAARRSARECGLTSTEGCTRIASSCEGS